ncbi:MAG: hypothetical protein F4X12_01840 [Acidobacteriia bacterium]|nr:hypothetical protein [Terriglobia bacterium]
MADILSRAQRQLNVSWIRGRHTESELVLRRSLLGRGLRYMLHPKDLPRRPEHI